ncbi:MAG: diacylglycerol kinase family protein [Verrucomicrobiaceae bacterium]
MFRWIATIFRSFGPAWSGLAWAMREQRNLRAHALFTSLAMVFGWWLQIEAWEWCAVMLASGLVWVAELLNTALEVLADRVSREREESIRRVKDTAAAAVLLAAVAAFIVGLIIFLPKLWRLI